MDYRDYYLATYGRVHYKPHAAPEEQLLTGSVDDQSNPPNEGEKIALLLPAVSELSGRRNDVRLSDNGRPELYGYAHRILWLLVAATAFKFQT